MQVFGGYGNNRLVFERYTRWARGWEALCTDSLMASHLPHSICTSWAYLITGGPTALGNRISDKNISSVSLSIY